MSRNASGTYSLPAGQPVVTGTVISASTFNTLTSDISTEITDSLSRSNKGAMLAALLLHDGASATVPDVTWSGDTDTGAGHSAANTFNLICGGATVAALTTAGVAVTGTLSVSTTVLASNGTVAAPSVSFTNDTGSGLYRIGANDLGFAVNGTKRMEWTTAGASVNGTFSVSSPSGVAKAWGRIHTNGIGGSVDDAVFNATSSISGTDVLITFGTAIGSTSYTIVAIVGNDAGGSFSSLVTTHTRASGSFKLSVSSSISGAHQDSSALGFNLYFAVYA